MGAPQGLGKMRAPAMYFDYTNVLVFLAVGIGFVFVNMALGSLFRPRLPTSEQQTPYECGEDPIGDAWVRFDIRYYTVALVYIVFGVEIAFLFPWAVVLKSAFADERIGGMAFVEGVLFVGVLFLGLVYVWAKGDLDWVKSYSARAYRPAPTPTPGFRAFPDPAEVPAVMTGPPAAVESSTRPAASLGAGAPPSHVTPRS
ncbi:MAG: NADH-quinone oxidoreductase subunit A [Planctomycetota bacterium]